MQSALSLSGNLDISGSTSLLAALSPSAYSTASLTVGGTLEVHGGAAARFTGSLGASTVKVNFKRPQPFPYTTLCGPTGQIVPKHVFEPFKGAKSREAPANLKPVGTGPYKFVDFKPGDVVHAELNPNYHVPNRPYFDTVEMKGGGDAASAARAVIQTGEYDFAWNTQVEDEILLKLENSGNARGRIEIVPSMAVEHIQINSADPWTEVYRTSWIRVENMN